MNSFPMLTMSERTRFLDKTAAVYLAHRVQARAHGWLLNYTLEDLRGLVISHWGANACPYCLGRVDGDTFVVDHNNPIQRGGGFLFRNLAVLCNDCARAKGILDHTEFREIMRAVRSWPRPMGKNFLVRLQAGAASAPALPEVDSLDWFINL